MAATEVLRAYRVALDPTQAQAAALASHAGASRAAYNYHLAAKRDAHRRYSQELAAATYLEHRDLDPVAAARAAKKTAASRVRFPTYMDSIKAFCADPSNAWHSEVNRYALTSGMQAADRAWSNWLASLNGARAGARVGYPRFHAKGRTRDSFTLYHDVKKPTLRPHGYRRLVLPAKITGGRGGSIRLHGNLRHLARRITKGTARIQSVTITRGGRRWYASVLAKEVIDLPEHANRRQRAGGPVGVDVGVHHYAALSTGELVLNPRHLRAATTRLVKAQQALSRTGWWLLDSDDTIVGFTRTPRRGQRRRPTTRRVKAQARVARAHADLAERRATTQHALTKRLSTSHDVVAIEDLNVAGMTRTARGTLEQPGSNVRAKAGLNRSILDVGFGEIRRQLTYKTSWYGSRLAVIDRWEPTSKTCSTCGTARATLPLTEREYHCTTCDTRIDRDLNAARNILAAATVMHDDARGKQESRNAHGGPGAGTSATSRRCEEGQDPPGTGHPDLGTGRPPPQTQRGLGAPAA